MMKTRYISKGVVDTQTIAYNLAQRLKRGVVITLEGQLASGKTTFTQGFGRGLHITDPINSPTFTLSKIYEGDFPLIHIDAYRLEGLDQDLGFEDYFNDEWMVLIEWPLYIEASLPSERIKIKIEILEDDQRMIEIESNISDLKIEGLL